MNSEWTLTIILYITAMLVFTAYIGMKRIKTKYILSISNAYIFQYLIILFFIPFFCFTPIAWVKLLGESRSEMADIYYPYIVKCMQINLIGFILFTFSLYTFEFVLCKGNFIKRITKYTEKHISSFLLDIEFLICIIIYFFIAFTVGGGFNISGDSDLDSTIGFIYYLNMAVQSIITLLTFYYGFYVINDRKKKLFFIIGIIACFLMGKRATLIMDILFGLLIYFLYKKSGAKRRNKVFFKAIIFIAPLIILAIFIVDSRSNSSNSNFTIWQEFLYGNTFCDIRDGSLLLHGFENKTNSTFIYGKSYLSALLSFVPSNMLSLRNTYDWGRFSTTALLGWHNHPGFRGGWALEGYFNFGWIGVFLSSIGAGFVYGRLEKYFRDNMFDGVNNKITPKSSLIVYILITLARKILCSAGFFAVYVMILFLVINYILNSFFRRVD